MAVADGGTGPSAETHPRIGVLGGTFDPPHVGHLVAAVNARHDLALDVVLLVVANAPWQKVGTRAITPAEDRLAMVEAAVDGVEGVEASRLEIDRGGTTYTVDTLETLAAQDAAAEFFLVVGADVAGELGSWREVERVQEMVALVVATRPGFSMVELPGWRSVPLAIPSIDVSSTELRQRAAEGRPLDFLVPSGVIRVIEERHLYAPTR